MLFVYSDLVNQWFICSYTDYCNQCVNLCSFWQVGGNDCWIPACSIYGQCYHCYFFRISSSLQIIIIIETMKLVSLKWKCANTWLSVHFRWLSKIIRHPQFCLFVWVFSEKGQNLHFVLVTIITSERLIKYNPGDFLFCPSKVLFKLNINWSNLIIILKCRQFLWKPK